MVHLEFNRPDVYFLRFLLYLVASPPNAARLTPTQAARPNLPCQVVKCFLIAISLFRNMEPEPPASTKILN